jgi:drug/metabolite transporter (DMT)-like permease
VLLLGLLAALAAAGANAGAALLEASAARRASRPATIVLHPMYLGGLALDIGGWVLTVIALRFMPIMAVQAIVAGQVAITVVASHWVFDTPLRRLDLVAAGANVIGLALLVASASVDDEPLVPTSGAIVALLATFVVLAAVGIPVSIRSHRAVLVSFIAGLAFGGTAVAVRLVDLGGSLEDMASQALASPAVWAMLGFAVLGLATYTLALQKGHVGPVVAVLAVTETLVPGFIGLIWLGDSIRPGWTPAFVLGLVLALGGVVVLARSPAQASLSGDDGVGPPPPPKTSGGEKSVAHRRGSVAEGVLDLLAGVLEVAGGLVLLALGLEALVADRPADAFLDLALELLGLVVDLVVLRHDRLLTARRRRRAVGGLSTPGRTGQRAALSKSCADDVTRAGQGPRRRSRGRPAGGRRGGRRRPARARGRRNRPRRSARG